MTRNRLLQITHPQGETLKARGWEGIGLWDADYARHNNCHGMRELLAETGADYLVIGARDAQDCGPPLSQVFLNDDFAVYHFAGTIASRATALDPR